jgi:glycosyltransferase involved in cell wall biosynthesis
LGERLVVGTNHTGYPEQRNYLGLPFADVRFQPTPDLCGVLSAGCFRLFRASPLLLRNLHVPLPGSRPRLWHFFNGISLGRDPWICTYESLLPRWGALSRRRRSLGLRLLAARSCRALLAISRFSHDLQIRVMSRAFGAIVPEILPKMRVLHPPQPTLLDRWEEKGVPADRLEVTFVGREVFRKGGREAVRAVLTLAREDRPIHLNLVSSLAPDPVTATTSADREALLADIAAAGAAVTHYPSLPNEEVLGLLRRSHAALLPTYSDTYGYSVLEAQACGCPVITSDIKALPELNDDGCGWVIRLPDKIDGAKARLRTPRERRRTGEAIREQLEEILRQVMDRPELVREKGKRALERIRERHAPEDRVREIRRIYDEALAS